MEHFECGICLQEFREPKVISCGHTFCKNCLQQLKKSPPSCPLCQQSFPSVDSLPSNFVVLGWMEDLKGKKIENAKCFNCGVGAVVWCEGCCGGTDYCKECDEKIHGFKATQIHVRITVKEKSKKPVFTKCGNHFRDEEVYCISCKSLVCSLCVIDDHQQHRAQSVFKYGEEKRVHLKELVKPFQNLEPLKNIKRDLELSMEKDEEELKRIENRAQVLKEQIIQYRLKKDQIELQTQQVKTSEVVLMNSIQEMNILDLVDENNLDLMKKKIHVLLNEVYPQHNTIQLTTEASDPKQLKSEQVHTQESRPAALGNKENMETKEVSIDPQSQKLVIDQLVRDQGYLTEGKMYYLLSNEWWKAWKNWSGYDTIQKGGPPGPINNHSLLDTNEGTDVVGKNKQENVDYVVLDKTVWDQFLAWFGGGPTIIRKCIKQRSAYQTSLIVEVQKLQLLVVWSKRPEDVIKHWFSRADTIDYFLDEMCTILNFNKQKIRVYDFHGQRKLKHLTEWGKSLEQSQIYDKQHMLIEEL